MPFLPIVSRELRISSRRRTTYWMRSLLALGVLTIWLFLLVASGTALRPAQRAQMLFTALAILCFGFCLLAGVFITADSVSEEKREGTIGLLFLTDLKGYDVIIGKLAATSLNTVYGLVAVLPLLALPLLMGGVSKGEFLRVTLALLTTLFFSLSLGMGISTFSREARQAMAGTLLVILVFTGIFPSLAATGLWVFRGGATWEVLYWFSPGNLLARGFDANFNKANFWHPFITISSLAIGSIALGSLYLPSAWRDAEAGGTGRGTGYGRWWGWRFGSDQWRASRRPLVAGDTVRGETHLECADISVISNSAVRHPELKRRDVAALQNPFYWLGTRDRLPQMLAWAVIGFLFCIWLCFFAGTFSTDPTEFFQALSFLSAYFVHQALKFLIACEACRRLSEDRRNGALELLLVTPLRAEQIVEGQCAALRHIFRGSIYLVLIANICLFFRVVGWASSLPHKMDSEDAACFILIVIGGAVMLSLDFYALSWVGMTRALLARRYHVAILGTLGRVMLPPWLAAFFLWLLGESGAFGGSSRGMIPVLLGWFGLGITTDIVFAARARRILGNRFQQIAALGTAK